MTADVPVVGRTRISAAPAMPIKEVTSFLIGISFFCWAHLTVTREQFPGSPAAHDVPLYAAPAIAILCALVGWRAGHMFGNRLILLGGLIWLSAAATASWRALDPVLALAWTAVLLAALGLLVTGADRSTLTIGMAIGVAASLPLVLFQAVNQTTWPVAIIQGWAGGELTGAVRGAAVLGEARWLRPYGLMPHPNISGGIAAVACVQLAGAWLRDRRGWQLLAVSAAFAESLLSFSRSAWLGAVLGLIALGVIHRSNLRALLLAVALPAFLFSAVLGSLALHRTAADGALEADSLSQRVYLMRTALTLWRQHPLIGLGPAQFSQAEVELYGSSFIPEPVHNAVLLVLVETGLTGLAGAALVVAGISRRVHRQHDWDTLAVALAILPPLMLDHYLMTSGIGLILIAAALSLPSATLPANRSCEPEAAGYGLRPAADLELMHA